MLRSKLGAGCLLGVLGCIAACGFPRPAIIGDDAGGNGSPDSGGNGSIDAGGDGGGRSDAAADALVPDAFVAPPLVTAFSPNWGSTSGGTRVRVLGFGFTGPGLVVKFGAATASSVTVVSDTELTLTTPVGPHAPVDLVVATQGGGRRRAASIATSRRSTRPMRAVPRRGTSTS